MILYFCSSLQYRSALVVTRMREFILSNVPQISLSTQIFKIYRKHPTPMTIQLHPQCLLGIQGILRNWTFLIFKQV